MKLTTEDKAAAEKYADESAMDVREDCVHDFIAGILHERERAEVLVSALEYYAQFSFNIHAIEALKLWRKEWAVSLRDKILERARFDSSKLHLNQYDTTYGDYAKQENARLYELIEALANVAEAADFDNSHWPSLRLADALAALKKLFGGSNE